MLKQVVSRNTAWVRSTLPRGQHYANKTRETHPPFFARDPSPNLDPPPAQMVQSTKKGVALEVTGIALALVGNVTQVIPLPYAQQVIALAQKILTTTQEVRNNKEGYQRLDKDLRQLVHVADELMAHAQSDESKRNLRNLVGSLTDLIDLALERTSQNLVLRLFTSGTDAAKIQEYRAGVRQALDVFMFGTIAKIDARTEQMALQDSAPGRAPEASRRQGGLSSQQKHGWGVPPSSSRTSSAKGASDSTPMVSPPEQCGQSSIIRAEIS
ncbi:hypothetical protein C8F04DRAFT_1095236 [Mycena alexandri]|uniref:Uncharacterized protein n=1 Tax=Mycena alexandri TaxID=1745969 RepID=A0AAD6SYX5_9AGAR|nr:hypothetical protein C8F04DRAFT_1095236 [Mycena alexandri]